MLDTHMDLFHIYIHEGHPLNELVDALATEAGVGSVRWIPKSCSPFTKRRKGDWRMAEWAFLHTRTGEARAAYPEMSVDGGEIIPTIDAHRELRLPANVIAGDIDNGVVVRAQAFGTVETYVPLTGCDHQRTDIEASWQRRCLFRSIEEEKVSPCRLTKDQEEIGWRPSCWFVSCRSIGGN